MAIRRRPDETCPMCGQTLPARDHFGLQLTQSQRILLEAVQSAGMQGASKERLMRALYDSYPRSPNAIAVLLSKLNKQLRKVGREVVWCGYSPKRYRVVEMLSKESPS